MNEHPTFDRFRPLTEVELATVPSLAPAPEWTPIVPVPQGVKLPGYLINACCPSGYVFDKQYWVYMTPDGGISTVIVRYNAAEGGGKEFKPFTYCRNVAGKCEWRCRALPEPRPLYGLDKLAAAPDAPVIVCEGEKSADAAALIFPSFVAVTSSGGAKAFDKADWKPIAGRDVVMWPDHDIAGEKYAVGTAGLALAAGARSVRIVPIPDTFPHKWDLADSVPEGEDLQAIFGAAAPFDAQAQRAFDSFDGAKGRRFSETEWPEPKPLPDGLLPVAAFDSAFLPEAISPWVMDISDRMQCPPDFVGIPAMVALGSVIGRKVAVRPQRKTDWYEVANLWGCIVGRPGAMKSPAMDEALKPLHRLEVGARKANEAEAKEYALEVEFNKLKREDAAKKARKNIGLSNAADLAIDEPEEPKARRYVVNDATYEALGVILSDNPNGTLAFRDELVSLLKTLDREEHIAARGFFLTAWNGTSGYTFDRIIRGKTHIEAACLSLLGSTQPGRLAEYMRGALSGGAGDDGMVQRFSLLVWPDQSRDWKNTDRYPASEPRAAAWDTFRRLDELTPEAAGAASDEFAPIPFLRFNETAQGVFVEWHQELETRLRSDDLMPALESHLAKYRKLVPALALINHLVDGGTGAISETAIVRALAFSEYLESHAKRAYGAGSEIETSSAKAILSRIRKGDLQDNFTGRDVHRPRWANLSDRSHVQAGLDLLVDLDWVSAGRRDVGASGGRPSITYRINPRGLA